MARRDAGNLAQKAEVRRIDESQHLAGQARIGLDRGGKFGWPVVRIARQFQDLDGTVWQCRQLRIGQQLAASRVFRRDSLCILRQTAGQATRTARGSPRRTCGKAAGWRPARTGVGENQGRAPQSGRPGPHRGLLKTCANFPGRANRPLRPPQTTALTFGLIHAGPVLHFGPRAKTTRRASISGPNVLRIMHLAPRRWWTPSRLAPKVHSKGAMVSGDRRRCSHRLANRRSPAFSKSPFYAAPTRPVGSTCRDSAGLVGRRHLAGRRASSGGGQPLGANPRRLGAGRIAEAAWPRLRTGGCIR